jgi:transcriptional regulator with XRE-family HTH domain
MAEKNIKQVEMAKHLGISKNAFSMKLNEKSTFDEKEVCGIAKRLEVEVSFLFI